jgi:small acid-soluble spore protein (thioredoxin-like protein)
MEAYTMAKPDNRSDNVDHLQEHVQNTIDNLEEAESYLDEHAEEISPEEASAIRNKNENRRESIKGFRSEIKDEAHSEE